MINLAQKVGQGFVNAVFKSVHSNYDKANDAMSLFLHRKWKKDFVSMLNIDESSHILDLASGTGDIAKLLLQKTNNVTLCDINSAMLDVAKSKVGNIPEYIVADAKTLPFQDANFDVVTCVFGIRNFQEIEQSIVEVRRVLKDGGIFAVMEFMPEAEGKAYNLAYQSYIKYMLPKYDLIFKNSSDSYSYLSKSILEFQTRNQFKTLLEKNGFQVITPSMMNGTVGVFLCTKK